MSLIDISIWLATSNWYIRRKMHKLETSAPNYSVTVVIFVINQLWKPDS